MDLLDWLKNSVPGIVLLGAAGSLLALALLKMAFPIRRVIRLQAVLIDHLAGWFAHRHVTITAAFLESCKSEGNPTGAVLFVAVRAIRFVLLAWAVFSIAKIIISAFSIAPRPWWIPLAAIGAWTLLALALLDALTLVMTYAYFVIVPLLHAKSEHKEEVSWKTSALKEAIRKGQQGGDRGA